MRRSLLKAKNFIKHFLFNKTSIKVIPLLIMISIIAYIYFKGNYKEITNAFYKLNLELVLLVFLLMSVRPLLDSIRWFVITKLFSKTQLISLHKATVFGYSINALGITIGVEASKFAVIKNELGSQKALTLLIIERFISASIKILFIIISALVIFSEIIFNQFSIYILLAFIFTLTMAFYFLKRNNIILKHYYNFKAYFFNTINYIKLIKNNLLNIVVIGISCQLYNICIYIFIFYIIQININISDLFILVPFIEILSQVGALVPAAQEFATIILFSQTGLLFETTVFIALFYRIGDIFGIGLNLLIIALYDKIKQN